MPDNITRLVEDLTGQSPPIKKDVAQAIDDLLKRSGIGYSQLNELLLSLGYDRVTPHFFQLLVDGRTTYETGAAITSLQEFRKGVDRFRIRAILRFGNVKYAFKYLSSLDENGLATEMQVFDPVDVDEFRRRHDPLMPVKPIPGDKTYYLGYLIKNELDQRLKTNPNDQSAKQELKAREGFVEAGKRNQEAYLTSDHMDVYVATSMRARHEYQITNEVISKVFTDDSLKDLKVRWFDPTQAYCEDRIDKGLAEGLMLKRATCTLYFVQESDTLGKDSELACTLAQGKPVIAFVPSVTPTEQDKYVEDLLALLRRGTPDADERDLILQQLQVFAPDKAWSDNTVIGWVGDRSQMDIETGKRFLGDCIRSHYDKRASTLKSSHPLGIQVHLETGVANGVLVARTATECAELIRRVLTKALEFEIQERMIGGSRYLLLKETTTASIFRVVTGDGFLTNAFWNFYLSK